MHGDGAAHQCPDPGRCCVAGAYAWRGWNAGVIVVLIALGGSRLAAQSTPDVTPSGANVALPDPQPVRGPLPAAVPAPDDSSKEDSPPLDSLPASLGGGRAPDLMHGQQTKRILGLMPNFQAVSANTNPPPLSPLDKFWLATEGTFDYSSFISVGIQAALVEATDSYPEFHVGAAAFARSYWHTFADAGVENYVVGGILPVITREDPRYYTLGAGSFFRRTRYALSRLWITRTDKGSTTFNVSEILGSAVAAEVSSRYYPRQERGVDKTLDRWLSQFINDGVSNMVQEFWPDIHDKLIRRL